MAGSEGRKWSSKNIYALQTFCDYFLWSWLLQHDTVEVICHKTVIKFDKQSLSSAYTLYLLLLICLPLWNANCWKAVAQVQCIGLSRQSVISFSCAKISIHAYTGNLDRPLDKYYWLVIAIFYCWYAEGCAALQLASTQSTEKYVLLCCPDWQLGTSLLQPQIKALYFRNKPQLQPTLSNLRPVDSSPSSPKPAKLGILFWCWFLIQLIC